LRTCGTATSSSLGLEFHVDFGDQCWLPPVPDQAPTGHDYSGITLVIVPCSVLAALSPVPVSNLCCAGPIGKTRITILFGLYPVVLLPLGVFSCRSRWGISHAFFGDYSTFFF